MFISKFAVFSVLTLYTHIVALVITDEQKCIAENCNNDFSDLNCVSKCQNNPAITKGNEKEIDRCTDTCFSGNSYSESRVCLEKCGKTAQAPDSLFNGSAQDYNVASENSNSYTSIENKPEALKDSNKDKGKGNSENIQIPFLEVPKSKTDTYNDQNPQDSANKITSNPIPANESYNNNKDNSSKNYENSDLDTEDKGKAISSTAEYSTETIEKANNAKNIRAKAVGTELEVPAKNSNISHSKISSSIGTAKLPNYIYTLFVVIFVIFTF
ncbi:hypothetical protein AYI69_g5706 [Smittium culicis]|uniref:Uncharacterized protein n=1 Tax=Smittium culicis TaxID=133412 RepID=A0A1R1Y4G2_9FUNG|nr:hypothetical protein AYI69_g5706 [Smittium culicis]